MPCSRLLRFISYTLALGLLISAGAGGVCADDALELQGAWEKSKLGGVHETFTIRGTGDRNNPLRRKLKQPFSGDQIFVQFRLTYASICIDQPTDGNGEFFVLWFDDHDGGDGATHTGRAPNVGVHVSEGKNRFMARYDAAKQAFTSVELEGDREYRVAARLSKSKRGPEQSFDRIDLWVNPGYDDEDSPNASATHAKAITTIEWFGFSTGRKTESKDQIHVSDVRLAGTWRTMLGLPPATPRPETKTTSVETQLGGKKTVDFNQHVLPILRDHCFECHWGADPDSGVRLDVVDEVLNRVAPRDGTASHLIALVRSSDDSQRMPPTDDGRAALTQSQTDTLTTWIDEGLEWDHAEMPTPAPRTDHWAFQPVSRPPVPKVTNQRWVRTPVDAFVARQHERRGVAPSELAAPEILTRRISLDLTGLPPNSPLELDDSQDTHALADALIEQQLSSPQYGQRYGRHWLDLARFGESNGHQHNRDRPNAWRYRDYVIESFRSGKRFDQFLREQIAGDEMDFSEDHLIATGFLAAARYSGNELDEEIQRNDILVDIVNTTSKALLGVTLECAQCHSHKFDPFTIRDYYRLQAFFGGQPGNLVLQEQSEQAQRLIAARWEMFDDVHARLVDGRRNKGYPEPVLVIPKSVFSGMNGIERELFVSLESEIKQLPQTWGWNAPSASSTSLAVAPHEMRWPLPRDPARIAAAPTLIRIRGDVKSRGPEVEPGWPAVFGPTPSEMDKPRTALADWLTSRDNPLTARVWVNRLWQWHFGRGIVETSGDFGTQGALPTHPELLDWLAAELMESDWSTNHIQRLILRSNTYRQSSAFSQSHENIDADNAFLWRWRPRRLEAESIRDSVLAVAGKLDLTVGGPSVGTNQAATSLRRSVYLQQKRDNLPEALSLFDAPEAVKSCSRRSVSTVSLQPLFLLNSDFMNSMASELAKRVRSAAASESDRARVAFEMVLGRKLDPEERRRSKDYLTENSLESFCQALLNLNEFLYIN